MNELYSQVKRFFPIAETTAIVSFGKYMASKYVRALIDDTTEPVALRILTRFLSFSELRTGIFTSLERLYLSHENIEVYYRTSNPTKSKLFQSTNSGVKTYNEEVVDQTLTASKMEPWSLLSNISYQVSEDLELFRKTKKWSIKIKVKPDSYQVVGKSKHLYIHPSAVVYPNVVFDVTTGPIIIDRDVRITSFSFLQGPLYVGYGTHIDNARITGGCVIGNVCRIGGEIENSIIGDFTNKHHEGFLGHSILGRWVNLGALTTTSDLKNNYGVVKIQVDSHSINTGTIKFGSMIGDFTKIGIGTMLNTGTIIDVGCNLVSPSIKGYVPAFSWLDSKQRYKLDRFIEDTKKIMARRNQTMNPNLEELIKNLYEHE